MPNRQKQTELARKVEFALTAIKIKANKIIQLRFLYFKGDTADVRFSIDFIVNR